MTRTTRRDLVKLGGGATALAALGAPVTGTAAAKTGRHRAHSLPVGYPMGPFVRDPGNPILRPGHAAVGVEVRLQPRGDRQGRPDPAALPRPGPGRRAPRSASRPRRDGVHFTRRNEPVMVATRALRAARRLRGPARRRVGGTYYMTYTGYDGTSARLVPRDVAQPRCTWTKHGPLFPDFADPRGRQAVEQVRRDPHNTPVDGRYFMYFGDKDIYYAYVQRPHPLDARARSTSPSCARRPGTYTQELLEPGPPPLITENG